MSGELQGSGYWVPIVAAAASQRERGASLAAQVLELAREELDAATYSACQRIVDICCGDDSRCAATEPPPPKRRSLRSSPGGAGGRVIPFPVPAGA